MASSTPSRLLAMLNSNSNSNSNSHSNSPPATRAQPQTNPNGSAPTVVPGPTAQPIKATTQNLSLQELFKNIAPLQSKSVPVSGQDHTIGTASTASSGSIPPPFTFGLESTAAAALTNGATATTTAATAPEKAISPLPQREQVKQSDQQNRLLGMLKNIGNPPATPQAETGLSKENGHGVRGGGPATAGTPGGYSQTESEAHKQVKDLLPGLKLDSLFPKKTNGSDAVQPVVQPLQKDRAEPVPAKEDAPPAPAVTHAADEPSIILPISNVPTSAPATSNNPTSDTAPSADSGETVDPAIAAILPTLPSVPAPAPAQRPLPPTPARSPFHFVSPFDAFGPSPPTPRNRTSSTTAPTPAATSGKSRKVSHSASTSISSSAAAPATGTATNSTPAPSILGKRPGSALDKLMPNAPAPPSRTLATAPAAAAPVVVPEEKTPVKPAERKREVEDVKPTKAELAAVTPGVKAVGKSSGEKVGSRPGTPVKKANGANGVKKSDAGGNGKSGQPALTTVVPSAPATMSDTPVIQQGAQGRTSTGPKAIGQHTVIDLSQSNSYSLVTDKDAVHIVPAAILKLQPVSAFQTGRAVAVTQGWMAYALSAGRIRMIDRDSGSRIVLQLPAGTATSGPIRDIAVTPTTVAVVGCDGSVTVFRVPSSWTMDNAPCRQIFHIPTHATAEGAEGGEGLGEVGRVEVVEKPDGDKLAICGSKGVILVDVQGEGARADMRELVKKYKVMTTEGNTLGFCLNQSQQAIALISANSYLTIYSVATSARVFHKTLPSFEISSPPTSVQFCETNLLIGRADNTYLELVQITSDISILGTIRFQSPPTLSIPTQDFCQAVYDPSRCIIWITSFLRGSLFGFQYTLKGRPPIPALEQEVGGVMPFSRMVEIPLDKVYNLGIAREVSDGPELIFAHKQGVSLVMVSDSVVEQLKKAVEGEEMERAVQVAKGMKPNKGVKTALTQPEAVKNTSEADGGNRERAINGGEQGRGGVQAQPTPEVVEVPIKQEKVETKKKEVGSTVLTATAAAPALAAPAPQAPATATKPIVETKSTTIQDDDEDNEPVIVEKNDPKAIVEETTRQMKKMEDRIVTQFRQALSSQIGGVNTRIDAIGSEKLASEIGSKVERSLKGHLSDMVRAEVTKSILPSITTSVKSELSSALPGLISTTMTDTLRGTIAKDLDRILVPVVQGSISKAVQSSVDRALHDALKNVVLPAVKQDLGKMFEGLVEELRGDILQMRKDLTPPPAQVDQHADQLKSMAASMADLQKQLSALSDLIRSTPPAPAPAPLATQQQQQQYIPAPPPIVPPTSAPPAAQQQAPNASNQLEDNFLAALSVGTITSTLALVQAHFQATDYILPTHIDPHTRPVLSQAVLLTLYHRLALALADLPRSHPMVGQLIQWERRVAGLLNPRSTTGSDIANFYPKVVAAVRDILEGVIQMYGPGDMAARALGEVLDVVAQRG